MPFSFFGFITYKEYQDSQLFTHFSLYHQKWQENELQQIYVATNGQAMQDAQDQMKIWQESEFAKLKQNMLVYLEEYKRKNW